MVPATTHYAVKNVSGVFILWLIYAFQGYSPPNRFLRDTGAIPVLAPIQVTTRMCTAALTDRSDPYHHQQQQQHPQQHQQHHHYLQTDTNNKNLAINNRKIMPYMRFCFIYSTRNASHNFNVLSFSQNNVIDTFNNDG